MRYIDRELEQPLAQAASRFPGRSLDRATPGRENMIAAAFIPQGRLFPAGRPDRRRAAAQRPAGLSRRGEDACDPGRGPERAGGFRPGSGPA